MPGLITPSVPRLAACRPSAVKIWRVKSATEVLPAVPVTATSRFRRARIKTRRRGRQGGSRIRDEDRGRTERFGRRPFGDDRHGARLDGALAHKRGHPRAFRQRRRRDRPASRRGCRTRARRSAGPPLPPEGGHHQELGEHHGRPCLSALAPSEQGDTGRPRSSRPSSIRSRFRSRSRLRQAWEWQLRLVESWRNSENRGNAVDDAPCHGARIPGGGGKAMRLGRALAARHRRRGTGISACRQGRWP